MPVAWTVKDTNGELLPRFIAGIPREVARKVVRNRYRELFDRDLKSAFARAGWRIVPVKKASAQRCTA